MQKKIGAILLVAGTCIGSGMIALPMVLVKLGLVPSILIMLFIWYIMYYSSLINLELNLQAGVGLSLGLLGRKFSGKIAALIGNSSLKTLSYSLLAVFIYGGSSIVQKLLMSKLGINISFIYIATIYSVILIGLLTMPIKTIDYINRILFISMLAIIVFLIGGLIMSISWTSLPLFSKQYTAASAWTSIIPIVFTSFGFQVIFHTLTNYCNKDKKMLKKVFLWGSLIPAIVYIIWNSSILSIIYQKNGSFYNKMATENVDVGELVSVLSLIAKGKSVQLLIWCISLLAIASSAIGVALGLCQSLKKMISDKISIKEKSSTLFSGIITIIPAYLVVILIPNAFIAVLGFAGMILTVIAIFLPLYLLRKIKIENFHYLELRSKWLTKFTIVIATVIFICEIINIIK